MGAAGRVVSCEWCPVAPAGPSLTSYFSGVRSPPGFAHPSSTFGWKILFTKPIDGDLYGYDSGSSTAETAWKQRATPKEVSRQATEYRSIRLLKTASGDGLEARLHSPRTFHSPPTYGLSFGPGNSTQNSLMLSSCMSTFQSLMRLQRADPGYIVRSKGVKRGTDAQPSQCSPHSRCLVFHGLRLSLCQDYCCDLFFSQPISQVAAGIAQLHDVHLAALAWGRHRCVSCALVTVPTRSQRVRRREHRLRRSVTAVVA